MDVDDMSMSHDHEHGHGHDHGNGEGSQFTPLSRYARLDTLVTVVDTFNVIHCLSSVETSAERQKLLGDEAEASKEEQEQSVADLLVDQIEFANIILLNKIDLVPGKTDEHKAAMVDKVRSLCKRLNPAATVVAPSRPKFEGFDVNGVLATGMFDMEDAQSSAGWMRELEKPEHTPETEEYGISSFVFRENNRPFHPERLAAIIDCFGRIDLSQAGEKMEKANGDGSREGKDIFAGIVRAKGSIWLANADAYPMDLHVAGRAFEIKPNTNELFLSGALDAVAKNNWRDAFSADFLAQFELAQQSWQWTEASGDHASELVCIGIGMDKEAIETGLQGALLTDIEMAKGKRSWKEFADPFFGGK